MNKKMKKLAAVLTILVMAVSVLEPILPVAHAEDGDETNKVTITVNLISREDGATNFVNSSDGKKVLMKVPLEVEYFDLKDYGLEEYYRYETVSPQDGGGYIDDDPEHLVKKPTVLHAMIKFAEEYYTGGETLDIGSDALTIEGKATEAKVHSYFGKGNPGAGYVGYLLDGEAPVMNADKKVATVDYSLLENGSELDIVAFDQEAEGGSFGIGRFNQESIETTTGEDITLKYEGKGLDQKNFAPMAKERLRVSKNGGKSWEEFTEKTNKKGEVTFSFNKPGDYIVTGPDEPSNEERASITLPVFKAKITGDDVEGAEGIVDVKPDADESNPELYDIVDNLKGDTTVDGYTAIPYDGTILTEPEYPLGVGQYDLADFEWEVDDDKIASVFQDGIVKGKKVGKTTVTGILERGDDQKPVKYVFHLTVGEATTPDEPDEPEVPEEPAKPEGKDLNATSWASGKYARFKWTLPKNADGVYVYRAYKKDGKYKYNFVSRVTDKNASKGYKLGSAGKTAFKLYPYTTVDGKRKTGKPTQAYYFSVYRKGTWSRYRNVKLTLPMPKGWSRSKARWYNYSKNLASVTSKGVVTTKYPGEANLCASWGRTTYNYYVRIRPNPPTKFAAKKYGSKKARLTWKPAYRAHGYNIYRGRTGKDGKYHYKHVTRISGGDRNSVILSMPYKGHYKFYVKAYTNIRGYRYVSKRTTVKYLKR